MNWIRTADLLGEGSSSRVEHRAGTRLPLRALSGDPPTGNPPIENHSLTLRPDDKDEGFARVLPDRRSGPGSRCRLHAGSRGTVRSRGREEKKEGDPARGAQEKEGDEQNSGVTHPVGPDWCEMRKRAKATEAGEASVTFFNRVLFTGSRGELFSPGNLGGFLVGELVAKAAGRPKPSIRRGLSRAIPA